MLFVVPDSRGSFRFRFPWTVPTNRKIYTVPEKQEIIPPSKRLRQSDSMYFCQEQSSDFMPDLN